MSEEGPRLCVGEDSEWLFGRRVSVVGAAGMRGDASKLPLPRPWSNKLGSVALPIRSDIVPLSWIANPAPVFVVVVAPCCCCC